MNLRFTRHQMTVTVVIVLYVVTWAVGVPRLHTRFAQEAIRAQEWERADLAKRLKITDLYRQDGLPFELRDLEEFKRLVDKMSRPAPGYVSFDFALPVFPLVILAKEDVHLRPQYGTDGWFLHFWYGWGFVDFCLWGTIS